MTEEMKEKSIRVVFVEPGKYAREAEIGTNINQIARQANYISFIDTNAYWENVKVLENEISDIKEEARK